jgi:hypothetical protein
MADKPTTARRDQNDASPRVWSNPLRLNLPRPLSWYHFRLRTLLFSVVLLCIPLGYFVYEVAIVRERKAMLEFGDDKPCRGVSFNDDEIPPFRRLLGDRGCYEIHLAANSSSGTLRYYKERFPEAHIVIDDP